MFSLRGFSVSASTILQLYINYPHWRLAIALRLLAVLFASSTITCDAIILLWKPIPENTPWWNLQSLNKGIPFLPVCCERQLWDRMNSRSPDCVVFLLHYLEYCKHHQIVRHQKTNSSRRRHRHRPLHFLIIHRHVGSSTPRPCQPIAFRRVVQSRNGRWET